MDNLTKKLLETLEEVRNWGISHGESYQYEAYHMLTDKVDDVIAEAREQIPQE